MNSRIQDDEPSACIDRVRRRLSITGLLAVMAFLTLVGGWLYSEWAYARHVRPDRIETLSSFLARYSEVDRAYKVSRSGAEYFLVTLRVRTGMALPSGPPAYVFDAKGRLMDWSADTGEDSRFNDSWPAAQMQPLDIRELKRVAESVGQENPTSSRAGR